MTDTCLHPREGQSTDNVFPGFICVGHETRHSAGRFHDLDLYRCPCGRLWVSWWIGGSFTWGEADEPQTKSAKKAGWKRTYREGCAPPRRRWWRR